METRLYYLGGNSVFRINNRGSEICVIEIKPFVPLVHGVVWVGFLKILAINFSFWIRPISLLNLNRSQLFKNTVLLDSNLKMEFVALPLI
jgi:hypothetical protein